MNEPRLISKTVPLTNHQLYCLQVRDIYDRLRAENTGMSHIPAQLGGTYGQRELLSEKNALDITEVS